MTHLHQEVFWTALKAPCGARQLRPSESSLDDTEATVVDAARGGELANGEAGGNAATANGMFQEVATHRHTFSFTKMCGCESHGQSQRSWPVALWMAVRYVEPERLAKSASPISLHRRDCRAKSL
jgi:hypothetical protein